MWEEPIFFFKYHLRRRPMHFLKSFNLKNFGYKQIQKSFKKNITCRKGHFFFNEYGYPHFFAKF